MEQLISTFDFTLCMAAYDGSQIVLDRRFLKHNKYGRLGINTVTYPVATINRIHKYRNKGFTMYEADLVELVAQISNQSFDSERLMLYID
jgi:hypothetical protein